MESYKTIVLFEKEDLWSSIEIMDDNGVKKNIVIISKQLVDKLKENDLYLFEILINFTKKINLLLYYNSNTKEWKKHNSVKYDIYINEKSIPIYTKPKAIVKTDSVKSTDKIVPEKNSFSEF